MRPIETPRAQVLPPERGDATKRVKRRRGEQGASGGEIQHKDGMTKCQG